MNALPPSTPSKNSPRLPGAPLPTLNVVSPQEHSLAALPPVPTSDPAGAPAAEEPEATKASEDMEGVQELAEPEALTVVEDGPEGGQDTKVHAPA